MAKKQLAGLIITSILATSGWAETPSPSLVATPPQPIWSDLTVQQKIILAPLGSDWDSLENYRQKKWLGIAARFANMKPEEQRRIQAQMQEWGKLTPEERQLARENFKTANQLPAEKKQELVQKWEEYSSLPQDEKEKLKQQAASNPVSKPGRPASTAPLLPVTGPTESPNAPLNLRTLPPKNPPAIEPSAAKPVAPPSPSETEAKP